MHHIGDPMGADTRGDARSCNVHFLIYGQARHTNPYFEPMSSDLNRLLSQLALAPTVLVSVHETQGSVPREKGAWMAVWADGQIGTIGGGHLEWDALRQCRERLAGAQGVSAAQSQWEQTVALGPSLGQCCGGKVRLRFEKVDAQDRTAIAQRFAPLAAPVALFGGGHVGRAIVQALAPLPFQVRWVDSRDEVFPSDLGPEVQAEHSEPVQAAVADLLPASMVLIMSFSHAEDLDTVAACLMRMRLLDDLPFVGLIGSATKWATFRRRLMERGFLESELARITCPIGLPGIEGKAPAVIAASVVAQLLLLESGA
jgi:xanthine dehydrogenase accessory factor